MLAFVCQGHGPGGAAFGVTGCFVSDERGISELDFVGVVENAVHFCCGVEEYAILTAEGEVLCSTGFDIGYVGVHDHVLRPGFMLDLGAASAMVVVGVADEQNLYIAPVEAEFLNARANLWRGSGEVAVDEDEALRRDDEIAGQVAAADVVEIGGDAVGRDDGGPVWIWIGDQSSRQGDGRGAEGYED